MENINKTIDELVSWLKSRVAKANAKGLVFGLSGGIDSAVIAGLSKLAFPDSSLGIIMPCHSDPIDEEHGLLVAKDLGLKTAKVDLSITYDNFVNSTGLDSGNRMAKANIKPRLRMTTLYYYGQDLNYLVAGSSNKSEFVVGYFTKHGDSGVDLLPLAEFVKSEIKDLAKSLNIPDIIINKPPSAGLWENQTDEKEMGFGYDVLDKYIREKKGPEDIIDRIEKMYYISEHKRKFPPIFKPDK